MSEVFSQKFLERLRRAGGRGDDAPIAARSVPGASRRPSASSIRERIGSSVA